MVVRSWLPGGAIFGSTESVGKMHFSICSGTHRRHKKGVFTQALQGNFKIVSGGDAHKLHVVLLHVPVTCRYDAVDLLVIVSGFMMKEGQHIDLGIVR
jgi:hypothetical protein